MDPQVIAANAVGVFVQHACPHTLQHRQRVGQGHLGGVVELEAQHACVRIQRPVQLDRQRRGGRQTGQHVGVFGRHRRREVLAVSGRKRGREAVRQHQTQAFAMGAQQLGAAIVLPALGQPRDTGFQRALVGDYRRIALGAHQVMDTCQRAVGQHRREFERLPVQRGHQLGTNLDPQLGVVAVARHEHLGRGETPKRVAAQEQPGALAFLQPQYADAVLG